MNFFSFASVGGTRGGFGGVFFKKNCGLESVRVGDLFEGRGSRGRGSRTSI